MTPEGESFEGATAPPGGPHAEVVALESAGARAQGATLYTTLEPCAHHGRTPPCTGAIVAAGVARVVVGVLDPDPQVSGRGVATLREQGVAVDVGLRPTRPPSSWRPTSSTGAPDGRGSCSSWRPRSTGASPRPTARRAGSPATRRAPMPIACGPCPTPCWWGRGPCAPTIPSSRCGSSPPPSTSRCGSSSAVRPTGARVHPALELSGEPGDGARRARGQGRAAVARRRRGRRGPRPSTRAGLVDRYVLYLAPALFGGDDAVPMFAGPGAPPGRGPLAGTVGLGRPQLGPDVRVELAPAEPRHVGRRGDGVTSFSAIEDAIAAIGRGRDRRGGRRRGPRERGRPGHGGRGRHAREDRLLPGPHLRRDLRAPAARAGRRARAPAHGERQHRVTAHRLHRQRRLPPRDHDGDLGRRPGRRPSTRSSTRTPGRSSSTGPATSSRCATGEVACSSAPGTPRPPSTS